MWSRIFARIQTNAIGTALRIAQLVEARPFNIWSCYLRFLNRTSAAIKSRNSGLLLKLTDSSAQMASIFPNREDPAAAVMLAECGIPMDLTLWAW